jgi:predicted enzyme related to lactoylglutathione lyase
VAMKARYVHTNLIANDWRTLAQFYQQVLGCVPVPPERDYSGPDLAQATSLAGASLRGIHLRLPGCGPDGPTLEIFEYGENLPEYSRAVNRPGFGHIAFAVEDVASARQEVLSAGGSSVGDVVASKTSEGALVTWCYVTDIEGNIFELQAWAP